MLPLSLSLHFLSTLILDDLRALAQRLAGQNAYERGEQLFQNKAVTYLHFDKLSIQAKVQGSKSYDVKLSLLNDTVDGGCSCPASEGFDYCKHCVATLLEYQKQLA